MARPKRVVEPSDAEVAEDLVALDEVFNVEQAVTTADIPPSAIIVKSAYLHSAIFVSGIPAEVHLSQSKIPGIRMGIMPYGLHCFARGKVFVVPHANIKSMVLK